MTAPHESLVEPTRIILIRHGETSWNVQQRIQGLTDIPLNEEGVWQAGRLARSLADAGLSAIYSSDLDRAYQTAMAVAKVTGLTVQKDVGLRERGFGVFEGHTWDEIAARWPEQSARWRRRDPGFGPEGGEALPDFYSRCVGAVMRLAEGHAGQTVAMVAHGGVLDCLYRAAARVGLQEARTWQLGNASINRLLYSAQGLTLVGWGDVAHLEGESLDDSVEADVAPAADASASLPDKAVK